MGPFQKEMFLMVYLKSELDNKGNDTITKSYQNLSTRWYGYGPPNCTQEKGLPPDHRAAGVRSINGEKFKTFTTI